MTELFDPDDKPSSSTENGRYAETIHPVVADYVNNNLSIVRHDTAEIVDIYLQRTADNSRMSLGKWFCMAHGINPESDIGRSTSVAEAKRLLWYRQYTLLPLEPLEAFNQVELRRNREGR